MLIPSYGGLLFDLEVRELSRFFAPARPFFLIVGGKKISSKLPLLKALFPKTDGILVGGAAANTLLEARGRQIGKSFSEKRAASILGPSLLHSKRLIAPVDVVTRRGGQRKTVPADAIHADAEIVDIGPGTITAWKNKLRGARSVLWSGPLGLVEAGFGAGTIAIARAIGKLRATRIVGGGDTITFFHKNRLLSNTDFSSTGGGAMLDFLSDGTLAGIEALRKSKRKFKLSPQPKGADEHVS
ncbi:MAG: phosphoglycerate kinase [Parcubacteria group bacterium]|nr:phosphoglycerate kinase [Parcubacteria group bacterium]